MKCSNEVYNEHTNIRQHNKYLLEKYATEFTGEIQPVAIHRTATVFVYIVNTALKEE